MISLDQVLLLQEKVETAVSRIAALSGEVRQLKAENDALRTRCSELTNALSAKTELVSSLESEQDKIEKSILNALNRLDTVENSILTTVAGASTPLSGMEPKAELSEAAIVPDVAVEVPEFSGADAAPSYNSVPSPVSNSAPDTASEVQPNPEAQMNSAAEEPLPGTYDIF